MAITPKRSMLFTTKTSVCLADLIHVQLQHVPRIIAWSAFSGCFCFESHCFNVQSINKCVNYTHLVFHTNIIIEGLWKKYNLVTIRPLYVTHFSTLRCGFLCYYYTISCSFIPPYPLVFGQSASQSVPRRRICVRARAFLLCVSRRGRPLARSFRSASAESQLPAISGVHIRAVPISSVPPPVKVTF